MDNDEGNSNIDLAPSEIIFIKYNKLNLRVLCGSHIDKLVCIRHGFLNVTNSAPSLREVFLGVLFLLCYLSCGTPYLRFLFRNITIKRLINHTHLSNSLFTPYSSRGCKPGLLCE